MHPDRAGAACNHVARELDKNVGHRHLIGREVNRLETEPLAERLVRELMNGLERAMRVLAK